MSRKRYEIGKKVNHKVVEHSRFSTRRHLVDINAKNRILKMRICKFVIYETVTLFKKRRKEYLSDEK